MKKYFVLGAVSIAAVWSSAALALVVPPGFVGTYTSLAGYQTWASSTGNLATAGEAVFTAASGGGLNAATKVAPLLADGRAVAMTVNRLASGAQLFGALRVLSGPLGISLVLMEAMPAILNWIGGDNAQHIRVASDGHSLEKKVSSGCTSMCINYRVALNQAPGVYFIASTALGACTSAVAAWTYVSYGGTNNQHGANARMVAGACNGDEIRNSDGVVMGTLSGPVGTVPADPTPDVWLPASMDDIAPYMTPRSPAVTFPDQLIAAGGTIPVSPVSLVTTAPPAEAPPYVHTTTYPKPADQTTRVETLGNPWGLPLNTPTVTRNATSSAAVAAGSSSDTGVNTSGAPINNPATVTTPTTIVDTSTWDGTKTTTTTVVSQNGATAQSTTTNVTNITNTTNTSTATVTNTTTRTVTDTTTNQPLAAPTTDTTTAPATEAPPDLCQLHPEILACATLGAPPAAEVLDKKTEAVTVTAIAFAGGGGCPAPLGFTAYGHSYAISYQPLCEKLIVLKFIFMSLAAVMAAYILADSFRVS